MYPHVTFLSVNEWDPQNVCAPKSSLTVEEEISSNIGAVMTKGGSPDLTDTDSDSDSLYQIYDIGTMTSQMFGIVKVALIPSRNVSGGKRDSTRCATGQYISFKGTTSNRVT